MSPSSELLGEERRDAIRRWLATEGKVRASALSERLGVLLDTVRGDPQVLRGGGARRPATCAAPTGARSRPPRPGRPASPRACPTTPPPRPRSPPLRRGSSARA